MDNGITPIEKFGSILASLGHSCAPGPKRLDIAREAELEGNGVDAMIRYVRAAAELFEDEAQASEGPDPVVPTIEIPPKLCHVTCTGRTEVVWVPGKTTVRNVEEEGKEGPYGRPLQPRWDYDSSFWGYIEDAEEPYPEDLMIRMILVHEALPGTPMGESFKSKNERLYKKAVSKFREHNPEWYDYLVANGSDRFPIERQIAREATISPW